jgi:transcriptional regulator with XRE-family HTH domain
MNASDQFKSEVVRVIRKKRLMIKQVADRTKPPLPRGSLSRMLNGDHEPGLNMVQRIADALNCEVVLFLRDRNEADYEI